MALALNTVKCDYLTPLGLKGLNFSCIALNWWVGFVSPEKRGLIYTVFETQPDVGRKSLFTTLVQMWSSIFYLRRLNFVTLSLCFVDLIRDIKHDVKHFVSEETDENLANEARQPWYVLYSKYPMTLWCQLQSIMAWKRLFTPTFFGERFWPVKFVRHIQDGPKN